MTPIALTDFDLACIARVKWTRFDRQTVIAIAGAWNAGRGAAAIADDHGTTVGTITCTLGRLTQAGVYLRPAPSAPARPAVPAPRHPIAIEIAEAHRARLERLAAHDPVAARCLELIHGRAPTVRPRSLPQPA